MYASCSRRNRIILQRLGAALSRAALALVPATVLAPVLAAALSPVLAPALSPVLAPVLSPVLAAAQAVDGGSEEANRALAAVYHCEVIYLPSRSTWIREVRLGVDPGQRLRIAIDRVTPHAVDVDGAVLHTAIDNERIVIDVGQQTWRSDFRGLASGYGRCVRADDP